MSADEIRNQLRQELLEDGRIRITGPPGLNFVMWGAVKIFSACQKDEKSICEGVFPVGTGVLICHGSGQVILLKRGETAQLA